MKQKILIYDLETDSVDAHTADPKLMGFMSSQVEGFQYTDNKKQMVALLNAHDVIVGYNIKEYDNVIMQRFGAQFYGKVLVDLMEIIHGKTFGNGIGRKSIISTKKGVHLGTILHSKSLEATTSALDGPLKIGEFDYSIFKRNFADLTAEEQRTALDYLRADISATEYIYKYCEEFFADFRDGGVDIDGEFKRFLTPFQIEKKFYLTSSVAALTYKIICNLANIEERYSDSPREDYGGGFVADPAQETAEGDIYCLDYNSLYPHIMMMCNLYAPETTSGENVWEGKGISHTTGKYSSNILAPVGNVLKRLYGKRLEYKKEKDAKEYTIKIIINTIYGLLGNPSFASVSNFTAAADCTRLGRQWVNAARLHFAENGYTVLYTDTDSVYVLDPFHNKQKLLEIKDQHINDIKASVPFPMDTFDMGVDDEIDFMAFFKGGDDRLLKKNYLYVTKDGKLKIKGMQVIKSTCTPLTQKIFKTYVEPSIIHEHKHRFQKRQYESWIEEMLRGDIKLASVFYKVKAPEMYALEHQVQAQIARHELYGEGQHNMLKLKVPHLKGAGVQHNYVGIEYAKEVSLGMLDLSKTWRELEPFVKSNQTTLEVFM